MYGASLQGLQVASPIIYRGTFGTGMFQCLYQPGAAPLGDVTQHSRMACSRPVARRGRGVVRPFGWVLAAGMLGFRCWSPPCKHPRSTLAAPSPWMLPTAHRPTLLCPAAGSVLDAIPDAAFIVRPHVRSRGLDGPRAPLSWRAVRSVAYWSETGSDRTEILRRAVAFMECIAGERYSTLAGSTGTFLSIATRGSSLKS